MSEPTAPVPRQSEPATERTRLITNVNYATIWRGGEPVRVQPAAVLLSATRGFGDDLIHKIRGLGPDPAWPVFDVFLGCKWTEHEVRDAEDRSVLFMGDSDDEPKPISSGATFAFNDGTQMYVTVENPAHPLDFEDFDRDDYDGVWSALRLKTARYWDAPNMPTLQYHSADAIRIALGVNR